MSCRNTYPLYNKRGKIIGFSACGECPVCRLKHAQELCFYSSCQAIDSYQKHLTAKFITLTYTDTEVPISTDTGKLTTRFSDFQDWKKRVSSRFSREPSLHKYKLKFLGTTEYGGHTFRPHMHAIVFDFPDNRLSNDILIDSWFPRGNVEIGPLAAGGSYYLTEYCSATPTREALKKLYDNEGVERPHLSHSYSLGGIYLDSLVRKSLDRNLCVNFNGHIAPLPSYIRRKYDPYGVLFNKYKYMSERSKRLKNMGYTEQSYYDMIYRKYLNRCHQQGIPVLDDSAHAVVLPPAKFGYDFSKPPSTAYDVLMQHGYAVADKIPTFS